MFDLRTKVMMGLASGMLISAIMLISVVFCLYMKIAKALKIAKDAESCIEQCKLNQDKVMRPKPIIAGSCRTLQRCDDCSIYADVGTLPPCFCGTNEGL
ncbi:protein FAM24A [Onychomys torridus]|uniref:protein FAM24A n=1 Tax=Onychomys torridus TaxID=38674 RepID=UPI00167F406E|nr:protein FAM24A [Onychomys torridus]